MSAIVNGLVGVPDAGAQGGVLECEGPGDGVLECLMWCERSSVLI